MCRHARRKLARLRCPRSRSSRRPTNCARAVTSSASTQPRTANILATYASSQWQVNNAYSKFFKQGSAGDANHQQCTYPSKRRAGNKAIDDGEIKCEACCRSFCDTVGHGAAQKKMCRDDHCDCVRKDHTASGGGGAGGY